MSDPIPPPPESGGSPADPAPPKTFFTSHQAEIGCGAALSGLLPVLVVLVPVLLKSGPMGARAWQEAGVWMFLLVLPAAFVATIVTIIPKTRRFGLGMLLGSGALLLLSLLTCSIR